MIYDRIESECEFTSINWNNSQYLSRFVFNLAPAERAAGDWTPLKENFSDKFLSGPVLNGSGPAPNGPDRSWCPDGSEWVRMGPDGSGWVRMGPDGSCDVIIYVWDQHLSNCDDLIELKYEFEFIENNK